MQARIRRERHLVTRAWHGSTLRANIEDLATDMSMEIERFDSTGRPNEKFVFRRGEIQERLIQKLLAILTPEQIARVPALADRAD